MYLALIILLAEEVAVEYIIADFAKLCSKQFSSKNGCDAVNDLPTLERKIFRVHARAKQVKILDVQRTSSAKFQE